MTYIVAARVSPSELLVAADRRLVGPAPAPPTQVAKLFGFGKSPSHAVVAIHGEFQVTAPHAKENISPMIGDLSHRLGDRAVSAGIVARELVASVPAVLGPATHRSQGEFLVFEWVNGEPRLTTVTVVQKPGQPASISVASQPHAMVEGWALSWPPNGMVPLNATPFTTPNTLRLTMAAFGRTSDAGGLCSEDETEIDVFRFTPESLQRV